MPRVRPVTSVALAALVVFFGAAACVPSDSRPTLGTAPVDTLSHEPTGNVDVDRVLARLDGVDGKTFTASYAIRRKLGDLERSASVVQLPPRTLVRIGDVSLFSDPPQQTCDAATGTCEDGLLEQRISDIGVSSRFYGPATAQQLPRRSGTGVVTTDRRHRTARGHRCRVPARAGRRRRGDLLRHR